MEMKINLVSLAISTLEKFTGTSYRGACISNKIIVRNYLTLDNIVSDPGFMSTSKSQEIAEDFIDGSDGCTPILMEINGSSAADVSKYAKTYLREDSLQYEEEEVLFNRGTEFKVQSIIKRADDWYGEINIIKLEEI